MDTSLLPMYVSDPVLNKDGIQAFTSYSVQGTRVPETLIRRYRDFDALRTTLRERWPGVLIPNIPKKKLVGANEKEVVDLRIELINRFCNKIANIGYLFNSEEMELFLQNTTDVSKLFSSLAPLSYEDILRKYQMTFTEYNENFDIIEAKALISKFLQTLNDSHERVRSFRNLIENLKKAYQASYESQNSLVSTIINYERDVIKEYNQGNEEKLIYFNSKNVDFCRGICDVQENIVNPYDRLYDEVAGEYLDLEAMIDALTSVNSLQENYDNLIKKLRETEKEITDIQAGKTSLKSNLKNLFTFKSRENSIDANMEKKAKLEAEINALGQLIKICCYNMEIEVKEFKVSSLETYYNDLMKLEETISKNNSIFNSLCNATINDNNVKALSN